MDCLYLVSSSSSREYVADCLETLALPRGNVQHFRYRRKYLHPMLDGKLADCPGQLNGALKGMPVVAMFRAVSRTADDTWESSTDYIPLRCGRLADAFFDGDIAHFFFEVTGYVDYADAERKTGPHRDVTSLIAGASKGQPSRYVFILQSALAGMEGTEESRTFQRFVENAYYPGEWRTISSGKTPLDITYEVIFYRVAGLFHESESSSHEYLLEEMTPNLVRVPGLPHAIYELTTNELYHIKLATHHHSSLGPAMLPGQGRARLCLEIDHNDFDAIRGTDLRIASAYDLHYWSLIPKRARHRSVIRVVSRSEPVRQSNSFVRSEVVAAELSLYTRLVRSGKEI